MGVSSVIECVNVNVNDYHLYILFCCMNVAILFLAVNPQGTEDVLQASGVYRLVRLYGQNIQDGAFCRAHITQTYCHEIFPSVNG